MQGEDELVTALRKAMNKISEVMSVSSTSDEEAGFEWKNRTTFAFLKNTKSLFLKVFHRRKFYFTLLSIKI